jgi:hypothetical protein
MIGSREIYKVLNSLGVEYVVIGGMAQTLQGLVIKTDDVDICPASNDENLTRLAEALGKLEAAEWDPHKGEEVARAWSPEVLRSDNLWILRTSQGPLDLLFDPAGTDGYESLSQDADVKKVGDLEVPVASIDSIIDMKEAARRPKDRDHLLLLYRLREMLDKREQDSGGTTPHL